MGTDDFVALPQAFDDLEIGITLHDPETGAIIDVNGRLEQLYGYSRAQLREMVVADYTPPSTRFTQEHAVRRIRDAAAGESQTFEWQIQRSTGEVRWVHVHLNRTTIDDSPYVLSEVQNVTEYKARERRLRLLNRVIRHNLRNETNVLVGHADRLKTAIETEALEKEIETIHEIAIEIGTISDSIHQIEEIVDPNATQRSVTNINDVVSDIVSHARDEYGDAEITIDAQTTLWVNADRGIRYAIKHAVENALVHNDRDRPSVTVELLENPNRNRGEVRIVDTGPSIPALEIDVLDLEVEKSSTYHGSGVGLWVMQWCVDALGGELVFEENEPRGNVVRLLLPQSEAPVDR